MPHAPLESPGRGGGDALFGDGGVCAALPVVTMTLWIGYSSRYRYFNDYNTLEASFLICGIMVLLGGTAYSVAKFGNAAYFDVLEYLVLLIVVASTIICALTILNELLQSIKYFALATKANRRLKVRPSPTVR